MREIGAHGTLLGAFARAQWPEESCTLAPGETLVAVTDGVTDTVGAADERFGNVRLRELLDELRGASPMAIRERVVAALERFQVGLQADDTAMLAMRRSADGPGGAPAARSSETAVRA